MTNDIATEIVNDKRHRYWHSKIYDKWYSYWHSTWQTA